MSALRTVTSVECTQPRLPKNPHAQTIQCPVCQKHFVVAAIAQDAPLWDPLTSRHHCRRGFYCDHCNHVVHWLQPCTSEGKLGPREEADYGITRDSGKHKPVEIFLRNHPEARGVTQEERP